MFTNLIYRVIKGKVEKQLRQAYSAGITKGYELGWMMRGTEINNKGFIIGSRMDQEIEAILQGKADG